MTLPCVLVVDDDWALRSLVEVVLADEGYSVITTDGRGAFAVAARVRPDVILMDLIMPTSAGDEICRQLRAHPATAAIPIVAMSGTGNLAATRLDQFNDQLSKPFPIHRLLEVVSRWARPRPD